MRSSFPIQILVENAWLPSREAVLERFKQRLAEKTAEREAKERSGKGS